MTLNVRCETVSSEFRLLKSARGLDINRFF